MWPDCQHDPTGLALLQECKDHPTETNRRLILADWLEEQGKPEEWIDLPRVVRQHWVPWNRWWIAPQPRVQATEGWPSWPLVALQADSHAKTE